MRTRLVAALTAAVLAVPFLSAAADAAPPTEEKCEASTGADDHCGDTRR